MFLSTTSLAGRRHVSTVVTLASLAAALLLGASREANAQCTTSSDCAWPVGCAFMGETGVALPIPGPVLIRSLVLTDRPPCTPVVGSPLVIDSFFDVFCDVSIDGGTTWLPRSAPGLGRSQLLLTSPPASNPRTFDTEMLMLNITGGTLPGGLMLRESPSQASRGHTEDTSLGGGLYKIDSFFDVFVELSLDNGMTWMPSSSPTHVRLGTGNPTPTRSSTWGAVKSFYR